jgi:hypothetical protein
MVAYIFAARRSMLEIFIGQMHLAPFSKETWTLLEATVRCPDQPRARASKISRIQPRPRTRLTPGGFHRKSRPVVVCSESQVDRRESVTPSIPELVR